MNRTLQFNNTGNLFNVKHILRCLLDWCLYAECFNMSCTCQNRKASLKKNKFIQGKAQPFALYKETTYMPKNYTINPYDKE